MKRQQASFGAWRPPLLSRNIYELAGDQMNRRFSLFVAVMVSVAGCSGNATPTSPSPPTTSTVVSPAGSWSGSISDPISGEGTTQLSLTDQAANSLTGTWSAMFRNGDSFSGPVVATPVQPNDYLITLSVQPLPPCASESGAGGSTLLAFTLINVVVTSNRLTAVSGRLSCSPGFRFGTVNLSKQ
jgi:hypothetical protein